MSDGGAGLQALEVAIRAGMTALGASLLGRLLGADTGHRGPRIACGAGHQAEFVGYRDKGLDTVLGPITLTRAYYHCAACKHGVVPRDDDLDVAGVSLSPGLRTITARIGAALPFAQAAALLAEIGGPTLGVKRIERAAEASGAAAAEAITTRAAAIRDRSQTCPAPDPLPDMLYIAVDGTGVPMTTKAVAGRPGKGPEGAARTREVKLAALFTQTRLDEHGRAVRDPHSTSYLATLAPVGQFSPLLAAEARRRGTEHIRQSVVLGDGAVWIWNMANQILPAATQIVDLYHARQHVHDLADAVAFILIDAEQWRTQRLADLEDGDIEALLDAANALPLVGVKATERDKALHYFTTNAHRMNYAHYRALGMFVGSGVVEAACKTVIGARLKLSGMHWSEPGASAILTLRAQHASGPWEQQVWTRPNNQTQTADLAHSRS